MERLRFPRFAVGGHDRGGRVAHRLALDHPDRVERLAVLDIVPTAEAWGRADARLYRIRRSAGQVNPHPCPYGPRASRSRARLRSGAGWTPE